MEIKVDPAEVLCALGCPDDFEPAFLSEIEGAAAELLRVSSPSYTSNVFPVRAKEGGLELLGTSLFLPGEDISRHLLGCGEAILFAATLGAGFDARLRLLQKTDMAAAVLFDTCGSAAIESYCDEIERELWLRGEKNKKHLTSRFSPGYGDLPVLLQQQFCAVLDSAKRCGVTASRFGALSPQKSVTAILGVSETKRDFMPRTCSRAGCKYNQNGVCVRI